MSLHDIVTLLILALPVAGLAWFAWTCTKPYQRRKKIDALKRLRLSKRYRGITIRNGNCAAVRHLTGNFFSLDKVPELPVKGCKALRCSCIYAGLNNRRYEDRRDTHDPRSVVRFEADHSDRRESRERRKSGHINWQDPGD